VAVMAQHDAPKERNREWCSTRKCKLEDMVETKEPIKNHQSRDTQLVCRIFDYPWSSPLSLLLYWSYLVCVARHVLIFPYFLIGSKIRTSLGFTVPFTQLSTGNHPGNTTMTLHLSNSLVIKNVADLTRRLTSHLTRAQNQS